MALERFFDWLRKPPAQRAEEERIAKLMRDLNSEEQETRLFAQRVLLLIVHNQHRDYSDAYIIRVLEVLSEQENLKNVEWVLWQIEVLSRPPKPYNVGDEVPVAAQICKHRLQDRYITGYSARTLLHPTSAPQSPDDLLRPAGAVPETHPESLLRATDSEPPKE